MAKKIAQNILDIALPPIRFCFVMVLVAMLFGLVRPMPASTQTTLGCKESADQSLNLPSRRSMNSSNDIVRVLNKSTWFSIPRAYFSYPPDECGHDTSFVLSLVLPDYLPVERVSVKEPSSIGPGGWGDIVQLIYGHLPKSDLNRAFEIYTRRLLDLNGPYQIIYGLRAMSFEDPTSQGKWIGKFDVFLIMDEGKVTTFIRCHQLTPGTERGCEQWFLYRGHELKVAFDRRRLRDWAELQSGLTAFLDRFVKSST